jgi:hypothetical protein
MLFLILQQPSRGSSNRGGSSRRTRRASSNGEKVKKAELKKASKAGVREEEKGQWWPCILTDFDLKTLRDKGFMASSIGSIRRRRRN